MIVDGFTAVGDPAPTQEMPGAEALPVQAPAEEWVVLQHGRYSYVYGPFRGADAETQAQAFARFLTSEVDPA